MLGSSALLEKGGGGMPPPFVLPVTYTCLFWRDDATRNASRPIFCISCHTNRVAHNNQRNAPDLLNYLEMVESGEIIEKRIEKNLPREQKEEKDEKFKEHNKISNN